MKFEKMILLRAARPMGEILRILNGHEVKEAQLAAYASPIDEEDLAEHYRLGEEIVKKEEQKRTKLQQYVDGWIDSGTNVAKWQRDNPGLLEEINQQLGKVRLTLVVQQEKRTKVLLSKPWFEKGFSHSDFDAAYLFSTLITGALNDRIGKCPRCQRYFATLKLHPNKVFCSRKCATGFTAVNSTRARRKRERREKLARARQALREFNKHSHLDQNWKDFVAKRTGINAKWLTRAVNEGALKSPRKHT